MAQKIEFTSKSRYKFQSGDSVGKISFSASENGPDVSIVIVNYNTADLTRKCIESVKKYTRGITYEIIVVDNGSTDNSIQTFKKLSLDRVIENNKNAGFAKANNQAIATSSGRYVLFLNSDTEVSSNLLSEIVKFMDENKRVGIIGCQLVGTDGKIQESGGYFPNLLRVFSWMTIQDIPFVDSLIKPFHPLKRKSFSANDNFFTKKQNLDWIIGAFMFVKHEVLDQIGGWDEDYFMYTEDVDLCFRARNKGWNVVYSPSWKILHYGGASSATTEFPLLSEFEGLKKFYRKFYPPWQYPLLRFLLKIGTFGRMVLFAILEGKESAKIYAKAFKQV